MNSQTVTVNLIPGLSTPAVVRVSQYDVGRPILFKVFDGTMPASFVSNTIATVVGTKPSGLGFSEVATISGNTASLNSTLTMTQELGMIPAEIRFTQGTTDIGTANFILAVEPSPHPEGTTDGTQETMQNLETRLQGQIDALDTRVDALEAGQGGGSGLTDDVKTALLQIAQKVAYIDAHGQDYYDDLYDALYNDTTRSVLLVLSHVSSSNTQSTVEAGDSYTTTLTASTNYTINSVSVTMGGVDVTSTTYSSGTITIPSVTGNIVITATAVLAATSITATYTQSGTVYNTDSLDSLKSDLVVTANYSGGTTATISSTDYTLSGTLAVGTSTVTVTYAGLTTTFSVTVTAAPIDTTAQVDTDHANKGQSNTFGQYTSHTGFYPTIKYDLGTLSAVSGVYDLVKGIIPVDATGSTTSRAWLYYQDNTGIATSAYGTGKPMQVYSDSMVEGGVSITADAGYVAITIPVHIDYLADSYLYVQSSGKVLFAGANTPYYGMSNISEAT